MKMPKSFDKGRNMPYGQEYLDVVNNISQVGDGIRSTVSDDIDREGYGELIKKQGEKRKKDYWANAQERALKNLSRNDFSRILWEYYRSRPYLGIEKDYKYVGEMEGTEKENYIIKYLRDDWLYRLDSERTMMGLIERKEYSYEFRKNGKIKMKPYDVLYANSRGLSLIQISEILESFDFEEGMQLYLNGNGFGDEGVMELLKKINIIPTGATLDLGRNNIEYKGAEAISNIKFGEGACLNLYGNRIGDKGVEMMAKNWVLNVGVDVCLYGNNIGNEGAKAIAQNLNLEYGVHLNLAENKIRDEGIEAIAKNLKLKEGVTLDFRFNAFEDKGAEAIINNMELKSGVHLDLSSNHLSKEMKDRLKEWEKSYHDKGVKCRISV